MSRRIAGPMMPEHLLAKRKREEEEEELSAAVAAKAPATEEKKTRISGPAPPPAPLDERPPGSPPRASVDSDDDADTSSDDDDFGPAPPKPNKSEAEEEAAAQARLARFAATTAPTSSATDSKPKRDEWMIVPPKSEDWASKVDPTKIKNRKFQTGKGAKAPQRGGGENTLWTETPEQKRQRLEDEVMGRKGLATQGQETGSTNIREEKEKQETARRIREYNDKNRSKSLYEEHKSRARIEEDDPSKRAFDREKDIGGRKINHSQKKEMLNRAADFGSRFSSGNFL
ncbi:hypothetical protein BZA77DRAFT_265655 [Pyronema omphalodes]|nr:hypothetical protein BZA77DRAFT_265655 [Pyronema omphalodes]